MKAQLFDGLSAKAHDVEIEHVADQLVIRQSGEQIAVWPLADLRLVRPAAANKGPVLGSSSSPEQRLVFDDQAIFASLGDFGHRLSARDNSPTAVKSRRRVLIAAAAALGILIVLFFAVPWLAGPVSGFIPESVSISVGKQLTDALEGEFGGRCTNGEAQEVLTGLTARLAAGTNDLPPIAISVLSSDLSNALTAPGGYIVVFKGLIDAAEGSEELAGVIAHELAHAALRHPEESLVRQTGLGFLTSVLSQSGALSELATSVGGLLISTAYSRGDETAADQLALELLRRANISSRGFAAFFARLDSDQGGLENAFKYLSTHPPSGQRRKMIEQGGNSQGAALTSAEWRTLKLICAGE